MTFALADGGIETALTDRLQQDLPEFAAFVLLDSEPGRAALREYYRPFIELADRAGMPLVLDTPTWRANPDWLRLLGYDVAEVSRINTAAVTLLRTLIDELAPSVPVVVNGCIGPRFDDFVPDERMTPSEAEAYHTPQIAALAAAGADRVTSVTTLDAAEAIGVARAARAVGIPVAVSFTAGEHAAEAGGVVCLPSGSTLGDAIREVDAATAGAPIGFLINCAHPTEAAALLDGIGSGIDGGIGGQGAGFDRIIGFRLNAARHGEDGAGDSPREFAAGMAALRARAPQAALFGGCCGTDVPHLTAVAEALAR